MTPKRGLAERRAGHRPVPGDAKLCPRCQSGTVEFNERYRFNGIVTPAWVCDRAACGYRELVRREQPILPTAGELVRDSKDLAARARRTIMRAKARTARLRKRLTASTKKLRQRKKQ